ncbi:MAG: hypothetical protein K5839_08455 [Treponemataceae bacterium]|nr:hypothetical protein [Treponemataceae bacterium]
MMVLALFSAFAAKKTKEKAAPMPDWVTEPGSVYPDSQYFAQIGYDADRITSEVKACTAIASIFSQNVTEKTKASRRMQQAQANGLVSTSQSSSLSQDVTRNVNAENLIGVEIKGAWYSPKENVWYSIAVMDKPKTCEIYRQMISKNNEEIEELMEYETDDEYSFETFARIDFAQEIAALNERHLDRLRIINADLAASLKAQCRSAKELKLQLVEIAKNIPICVIVNGDVDNRIRAAFSSVFTKAGFRASTNPNERYVYEIDASFEESTTTDGKNFRCQYSLTGQLTDTGLDEELMAYSKSGRKTDVDFSKAKIKTLSAVETEIEKNFAKEFDKFLKELTVE